MKETTQPHKTYLALGDSMSIDAYTGVPGGGAVAQFYKRLCARGSDTWILDDRTVERSWTASVALENDLAFRGPVHRHHVITHRYDTRAGGGPFFTTPPAGPVAGRGFSFLAVLVVCIPTRPRWSGQ